VIVLHGGLGSAEAIVKGRGQAPLNLDKAADRHGFVVAYLNGTRAGPRVPETMRAWNAGICCGLPQREGVDDEGYIGRATAALVARYAVAADRVYVVGHSNGAMMGLAMACRNDVFSAVVAISGVLVLPVEACPAARGKRILAVHGADDENVPLAGGVGRRAISGVSYPAQARSKTIFEASGGSYELFVVNGAAHMLRGIDDALRRQDGHGLVERIVRFLKLE
jgi:polyhydroxybutyrate depolymerase